MLTFTSLASSSGGNCYLVTVDKSTLLIDPGIRYKSIQERLWRMGLMVAGLHGAICSHGHGDHAQSMKHLMRAGINCWASRETMESIGQLNNARAFIASPKELFEVGPFRILPFEAEHDQPGSLGYVIETGQGTVNYLVDSCYSRYQLPPCEILAVECNHSVALMRRNVELGIIDQEQFNRVLRTHMSLERLLDMLAVMDKRRLRQIFLLHLSASNSHAEGFREAVMRCTGVPVTVCAERN